MFLCRGGKQVPEDLGNKSELVGNQSLPQTCLLCSPNDRHLKYLPGDEESQVPKMVPLVYLLPDSEER